MTVFEGRLSTTSMAFNSTVNHLMVHDVIGIIIGCILMPFIVFGNMLVITVVIRFKRLQVPTNYFLVSLAVADLGIALLLPFYMAVELHMDSIDNVYLCMAPHCMGMTICGVSILSLTAIALDRCIAVANPMEYIHIVTGKKIITFTAVSWLYSSAISWSPFMGWHESISATNNACSFNLIHKNALILLLSALLFPPYLIILSCYFKIYIVARHQARAIAAVETSVFHNLEMRYLAKDTKYAKTLAIVIGFFVILWLPYEICLLVQAASQAVIPEWVQNYLTLITFVNSGFNPWIYAYKNNEFRAAFQRVIREMFRRCYSDRSRRGSMVSNLSSISSGGSGVRCLSRTNSRVSPMTYIRMMYSEEFNHMYGSQVNTCRPQSLPHALNRQDTPAFKRQTSSVDFYAGRYTPVSENASSMDLASVSLPRTRSASLARKYVLQELMEARDSGLDSGFSDQSPPGIVYP